MFAALAAKLIPVRDYLYLGLAVMALLGFLAYRHSLILKGERTKLAELAVSSRKLEFANAARLAIITKTYDGNLAAIKDANAKQAQIDAAQHVSDASRLRDFDAYRRAHERLAGAAGGPGPATTGDGGASRDDARFEQLELVALGLATAGRASQSALTACMSDRNALTGK